MKRWGSWVPAAFPCRRPAFPHRRLGIASLGGLLLLGLGRPGTTQAPEPAPRGIHCEFIRRIAVDFLNDELSIPDAWSRNDGAVHHDRLGAFSIFSLSAEDRYYEDITASRRSMSIRAHRLPGEPVPSTRVYCASPGGVPRYYYNPRSLVGRDQSVLLSFKHHCAQPPSSFRTYFLLDVLGVPAPVAASEEEPRPPDDGALRIPDRSPACAAVTRLGVDFLADGQEGEAARDTRSGRLPPGQLAAFALYALGDDASADQDVTEREGHIRARVWTAPGSPSAAGRFRLARVGDRHHWVYTPDRLSHRNRAAVLTFTYRCTGHHHRRDFLLEIPAGAGRSS